MSFRFTLILLMGLFILSCSSTPIELNDFVKASVCQNTKFSVFKKNAALQRIKFTTIENDYFVTEYQGEQCYYGCGNKISIHAEKAGLNSVKFMVKAKSAGVDGLAYDIRMTTELGDVLNKIRADLCAGADKRPITFNTN